MVYYRSPVPSTKSFDHQLKMANSYVPDDQSTHPRQPHQFQRHKKQANQSSLLKMSPCEGSHLAALDIFILIAVLGSCGFLVFPYVKLFCLGIAQFGTITVLTVRSEVVQAPMVYAFLGLSFLFAATAIWGIFFCTGKKCDNPNCRGLRKAAEFDIQLETEECTKNSSSKTDEAKGLFELGEGHHRELEAELKKMAPPNGRAVLVFRARCGCAVGKLQVWGPKKLKKIKK
ncbi:uncharacterized protein At5g19025-like [Aristolochia californica]|uniref:uncharacterized protein At5g19025-like n=1 Tax=Aristolochia californica TaxID=171875 RepID=UPI0035DB3581